MAIVKSPWAFGQYAIPTAGESGVVVAYTASYTFATGDEFATGDIVELAVLPADHLIASAVLIPEGNFGTGVTADVGIMSGTVGSDDQARTSGDEIFDGATLTGLVSAPNIKAYTSIARTDADRSIGVKFSGDVTGAGQKLTLLVLMYQ